MTTTDRFGWDIPTVDGDAGQWGTILNNLIDDDIETHTWISKSVSSDTTLDNYNAALVDASGGAVTVTLPSPTTDMQVAVKKTDSSSNTVTIATPGSETIDGDSSRTLDTQYVSRTIVSDGTNYFIL